jgi:hypothetical protein
MPTYDQLILNTTVVDRERHTGTLAGRILRHW